MQLFDAKGNEIHVDNGIAMNGAQVNSLVNKVFPTQESITKSASYLGGGAGQNMGGANVSQTSAFWYSPELTTESWLLPKKLAGNTGVMLSDA